MVASKDIRNAVVGLIILAIGIYFIINISAAYISPYLNKPGVAGKGGISGGLVSSISGIGSTIIMGAGGLAVIMIPLYILKRRSEKNDEKRKVELEDQKRNAWFREQQLTAERMQPTGQQGYDQPVRHPASQSPRYVQQPRGYNQQQNSRYNQSRQSGYDQSRRGYLQQPARFTNPSSPGYPYSPQTPKKPFRYSEEFIKGRKKTKELF